MRHPGDVGRHHQQAIGPHPRRQQRLVRIAEGGVCDADGLGFAHPLRESFRTLLGEQLLATMRRRCLEVDLRQLVLRVNRRRTGPVRLVHGHLGEVVENLGATVGRCSGGQQIGPLIDERRGDPAGPEIGIVDHRHQERDVGRHTPDPELGQRARARAIAAEKSRPRQVSLTSIESKCALISAPRLVPPSSRIPAPPGERYPVMRPVSGRKPLAGSSVVIRHCIAAHEPPACPGPGPAPPASPRRRCASGWRRDRRR